ncbi:MAG: hypothetical protein ACXVKA_16415 [Acidimicrobiia bacterium]
MAELRGHDLRCTLPAGWDGRIAVRNDGAPEAFRALGGDHPFTAHPRPVVHLANFGLPEERGDFGSGAVELMGDRDVFVVLFEYEPDAATTELFKPHGLPHPLAASAFDPAMLRRGIRGQTGYQSFFNEGGRAFCLYVVLGSARRRNALVQLVNAVLATVRITPRPPG